MERIPKPGEFYRHFKNQFYQIITIAKDSESGDALVVYQALYGDFASYVRPLTMFVSEVDRVKYPDVTQKYRFEQVEPSENIACILEKEAGRGLEKEVEISRGNREEIEQKSWFLHFLDAKTYGDRLSALDEIHGDVTQEKLEGIYEVLDMPNRGGSIEEQVYSIRRYLETQKRYDGRRLR